MYKKAFLVLGVLLLLLFTRVYNLDHTARLTRDESSDLMRIHQYYVEKKVTLVGPISSDNKKVFGSLTYYMLMPFAALGNFEPISPVYGAVFWGILAAVLMMYVAKRVNPKFLPYVIVLSVVWYPLLQTSRWAWNPSLIPFWIALGLGFFFRKTPLSYLLSGICLGLAFHNHYIAIFATGTFVLYAALLMMKQKKVKEALYLVVGFILPFVPFVLFDLRHPPGLFFSHFLMKNNLSDISSSTAPEYFANLLNNIKFFFFYITQNVWLAVLMTILSLGLLFYDIKHNKNAFIFIVPVLAQISGAAIVHVIASRYIIAAVLFFLVWLLLPRKKIGASLSKAGLILVIIGGLLSVYPQLHFPEVPPDLTTVSKINHLIRGLVRQHDLKDINIAALQSGDIEPQAQKYRDLLSMSGIRFRAPMEYDASSHLFVISTADIKSIRKGRDQALTIFSNSKQLHVFPIKKTPWKVYWFEK